MSSANIITMPKRFDYSASVQFNAAFAESLNGASNQDKTIILDCVNMDYIDSAGIGLLVMSHKKAKVAHAKMALINLKPQAKEILTLANLQKLIEIR
ncbi:MAG: STAS domain-containing protein [Pseudomonadota bacterium]